MMPEKNEIIAYVNDYLNRHNYNTNYELETGVTILSCKLSDKKAESLGIDIRDKYARAYYVLRHPDLIQEDKDEEPPYVKEKRILEMMAWA